METDMTQPEETVEEVQEEIQEQLPEPSEGLFNGNKDFMEFSPEDLSLVTL